MPVIPFVFLNLLPGILMMLNFDTFVILQITITSILHVIWGLSWISKRSTSLENELWIIARTVGLYGEATKRPIVGSEPPEISSELSATLLRLRNCMYSMPWVKTRHVLMRVLSLCHFD